MKKNNLLLFGILLLLGCNKYQHLDIEIPSCELCPFGKSIEGTYKGIVSGVVVIGDPDISTPNQTDSITLIVEQIFLNESRYIDSTILHFKTTHFFHYQATEVHSIIQISNSNGLVDNHGYKIFGVNKELPTNYFYITEEKAIIRYEFLDQYNYLIPGLIGTLYKQ